MTTRGQRIRQRLLGRYWLTRERQRVVARQGWQAFSPAPAPMGFDDFRPTQIAGCVLWVSADVGVYTDAGITLATDGQTVQQWEDRSGYGNHFIQATAASKPLLVFNVVNGKRVLRFDGSNDRMLTATLLPGVPIAQPTTIIIVARVAATAPPQVFYDSLTTREFAFKNNGGTGDFLYGASTTITGETPHTWGSFEIYTCIFNGASSASYINGVAKGTGDTGTQGLTRMILGDNGDPGSAPIDGDVPEFIAYNSALSSADRNNLHNYLGNKYGITVTL